LQNLENELLREGWRQPERWTLMNALTWLTAAPDPLKLPVFPCAEAGRMPSLTLVCSPVAGADADTRLVLRLWPADLQVRNDYTKSLWIGSVVEERLHRPLSLFTFTRAQPNVDAPRQVLAGAIETGRLATRGYSSKGWDGRVLLAQDADGN
jgi:LssY-like putative type I secretion system component LssY